MFSRNLVIFFACILAAVGNAEVCNERINIGSWVEITRFSINGRCVKELQVERGQEVKIHLEYYNPEKGCTGCKEQVYVGVRGQKLDCINHGNPSDHFEDDHVMTIPTDVEPGTYVIVAKGAWDWNCYDTRRTDGTPIATIRVVEAEPEHDQYIGCFKDDAQRDLGPSVPGLHSVDSCNVACSQYAFFGLQASHGGKAHCLCGNQYGSSAAYSQVDDSECPKRTGANMNGNRAGGGWRNAVYFVKTFNFQLRGADGTEIVVVTDGEETRERHLSNRWQTFAASNANIVIRFTNDYGPYRDVFFRSNTPTDIRSPQKFAELNCDTHYSSSCEAIRNGDFLWTADYQIEFKNAAYWKTCRWQSTQAKFVHKDENLVGWECADNEILTGFGINADEDDVSKIQCCELGGHSSIFPDTCTFIEAGEDFHYELASCNANDHKVFSGAYDASKLAGDSFTEIMVGKCCEVKCDAPWCRNKDWGVNTNQCRTIFADRDTTDAQDLVCPEGTLVTKVHDGFSKNAHGIQKVASVTCCEMDLISQPTRAPSQAPTTTKPSPSPTTAPTVAPSTTPSTTPSVAPTSTSDCLLALFQCNPPLSDAKILQGIQDCLPNCMVPQHYFERRALEGRLMSENAQ